MIAVEGGEEVPAGKVYLYGYDLRNFCGIDVPGLDEAMSATPKSRLQQRSAPGRRRGPPGPGGGAGGGPGQPGDGEQAGERAGVAMASRPGASESEWEW